MIPARARDRRVYLGSHPVLFALLAATRRWPVVRIGGNLLVHDRQAIVTALTRIPLDRTAAGTTGGAAGRLTGTEVLFDQHGAAHRRTRRATADRLGAAGVHRLRPVWTAVLDRGLAPLARGGAVDLVPLAAELSGTTAAALLDLDVDGRALAEAVRAAGAAAARAHLPRAATAAARRRAERAAEAAAARLTALVAPQAGPDAGLSTMLAVAAITTTVAALPRAAAWAADAGLWGYAGTHPQSLADELLRVTAPTPLLPRVAADPTTPAGKTDPTTPAGNADPTSPVWRGDSTTPGGNADPVIPGGKADPVMLAGKPVRAGDRLLLVTRHALAAHVRDPDPLHPAPAHVAHLVFGTGPHACPGARLARTQLADLLVALAPHRPVVVRARADRRSALPGWRSLVIRAAS